MPFVRYVQSVITCYVRLGKATEHPTHPHAGKSASNAIHFRCCHESVTESVKTSTNGILCGTNWVFLLMNTVTVLHCKGPIACMVLLQTDPADLGSCLKITFASLHHFIVIDLHPLALSRGNIHASTTTPSLTSIHLQCKHTCEVFAKYFFGRLLGC